MLKNIEHGGLPRMQSSDLLTAREVAKRLHVSIAWVLDHAGGRRRPVLPSLKMGKAVRFCERDIEAFLERCRRCMEKGIPVSKTDRTGDAPCGIRSDGKE